MPTYQIELPTGEKYQVESPAELTDQQAFLAAQQQMPKAQGNVQNMNKTLAIGELKPTSKWDSFLESPLMQKIIGQPSFIREAKEQFGAPVSSPSDIVRSIMSSDKPGPAIPAIGQQQGTAKQLGAGAANIVSQNIVNPLIHDPLSFATLGAGGGIGRALAGLFAGQIATQLPQEAANAGAVVGNPQSSLQEKIQAVGAPVAGAAMVVGAGGHAIHGNAPVASFEEQVARKAEAKGIRTESPETTKELQQGGMSQFLLKRSLPSHIPQQQKDERPWITKPLSDSIYKPNLPEYKQVDPSKPKNIPPQTKTDEQKQQDREMVLTGPWLARNAREEIGLDTSKASPEQTMNRLNNLTTSGKLSSTELQIYKDQGLEEFVKTKPTPEKLAEWMQEKGPRVVIDKKGEGSQSEEEKEYTNLRHNWYDSLGSEQKHRIDQYYSYQSNGEVEKADKVWELLKSNGLSNRAKLDRFNTLYDKYDKANPNSNAAHWQSISPKPESEMPGYVEGAVTIPLKLKPSEKLNSEERTMEKRSGQRLTEDPKFMPSHSFPPNTLGFFRGYMEGDTFHVIEVQSDWAAQQARLKEDAKGETGYLKDIDKKSDDPLLKDWERLTLKAAIQHAIGEGAKHIAVSDAPTAMMTEGQDRAAEASIQDTIENMALAKKLHNKEEGNGVQVPLEEHINKTPGRQIASEEAKTLKELGFTLDVKAPQEKGMRLHYDQILPKLLKELTGSEGVEKEFGEHRMAFEKPSGSERNEVVAGHGKTEEEALANAKKTNQRFTERANWQYKVKAESLDYVQRFPERRFVAYSFDPSLEVKRPRPDLIFKDKSGKPKTTITAKSFDLSKAKERQAFSLFDKDKTPAQSKQVAPSTDVDERLQKHWTSRLGLDKPSTVGDVMRRIVKDGSSYSEGTVSLAKLLDDHFNHVIDSAAVDAGKSPTGNRASYVPDEHKVYLDIGGRESGNVVGTVLHEGAHAAFHWLVETEPKVREAVAKIREQVIKSLPKGVQDFYNKTYLPGVLKNAEKLTGSDITSWFNEAGLDVKKWHETLYALQGNSEFVANIFNSKNFRDFLNEIPAESQSLWAKVKKFIADSLGIKPGTVLDKTFDILLEGRDAYKDEKNLPDAILAARDRLEVSKEKFTPPVPMPSEDGGKPVEDVLWFGDNFLKLKAPEKSWKGKAWDAFKHGVEVKLNQISRFSAPRTLAVSPKAANALIRFAAAEDAGPALGNVLANTVAGEQWKNKEWLDTVGSALVEDRLRAIEQSYREHGDEAAAKNVGHVWDSPNSPIVNEKQYKQVIANSKDAIDRFRKYVEAPSTAVHVRLGGKLAKPGPESGAFVNLKNMLGEEAAKDFMQGKNRSGNLKNPLERGSAFNKQAKGTGKNYDFNLRNIIKRMTEANYTEDTKRDFYETFVSEGLGKFGNERPKDFDSGQSVPIRIGYGKNENFWPRRDVESEVRQALQTDSRVRRGGTKFLIDGFTAVQLRGPTDVVVHLRNMFSAVAGSQGGGPLLYDLARKQYGIRELDTAVRLAWNLKKVWLNTPEIQKEIAEYSRIGAGRAEMLEKGWLEKILPTSKLIKLMDTTTRVTLNKMFDNLVERGWYEDKEEARREFVNRAVQYNKRLLTKFEQQAKESGFSPFLSAGKEFNSLALQRLTLDSHYSNMAAKNPEAALKLKLVEAVGMVSSLIVLPMVLNYYNTGNIWGRPGMKPGAVDLGTDDEKGRHKSIDLVQNVLLRRGLRNIGEEVAYKDLKQGRKPSEIIDDALMDMARGFAAPYEGPAIRFGKIVATGSDVGGRLVSENPKSHFLSDKRSQYYLGDNLLAALRESNPSLSKYFQAKEEGTSQIKGVLQPIIQATGYGVSRMPSLFEKELATPNVDKMDIRQRAELQKSLTKNETSLSTVQKLEIQQNAAPAEVGIERQVNNDLSQDTQKWLKSNNLKVPGFAEYLEQTGVKVYLLPKEREVYERVMVQSYEEQLAKAKGVVDREPTREMKQKVVDRFIKVAHGIARNRMRNMIGHIDE